MTSILIARVARTGWEEGAASFAHKMSKAPKPDAGKYPDPVKTNEIDFLHSFSGNQQKGLWLDLGDEHDAFNRIWKQHQRGGIWVSQ